MPKPDFSQFFSDLSDKAKELQEQPIIEEKQAETTTVKEENLPAEDATVETLKAEKKSYPGSTKSKAEQKTEPKEKTKKESALDKLLPSLKKTKQKCVVSISIDTDIAETISKFCEKNNINNISSIYNEILKESLKDLLQ